MCNEEKRGMGGEGKQVLWLTRRFMEFGTEYLVKLMAKLPLTLIVQNPDISQGIQKKKKRKRDYRGAK